MDRPGSVTRFDPPELDLLVTALKEPDVTIRFGESDYRVAVVSIERLSYDHDIIQFVVGCTDDATGEPLQFLVSYCDNRDGATFAHRVFYDDVERLIEAATADQNVDPSIITSAMS